MLLWVLVILGSPIWLSLGAAFVITVAAIYAAIWILAASVWIVALAFAATGPVFWVLAIDGVLIGHMAFAIAFLGIGLCTLGVGLLLGAAAFAATKSLARVSVMWLRKAFSPFTKGCTGEDSGGSTRGGSRPGGSHLLVEIHP